MWIEKLEILFFVFLLWVSVRLRKKCIFIYHFLWVLLQEEIHELLLSFAETGATVVRLKGGDPLVSFCIQITMIEMFEIY